MPSPRKEPDCTTHKVKFCGNNLEFVQIARAKMKGQSSIPAAVNKIVREWAFYKGLTPEKE